LDELIGIDVPVFRWKCERFATELQEWKTLVARTDDEVQVWAALVGYQSREMILGQDQADVDAFIAHGFLTGAD
jgi:hypothetical protein